MEIRGLETQQFSFDDEWDLVDVGEWPSLLVDLPEPEELSPVVGSCDQCGLDYASELAHLQSFGHDVSQAAAEERRRLRSLAGVRVRGGEQPPEEEQE